MPFSPPFSEPDRKTQIALLRQKLREDRETLRVLLAGGENGEEDGQGTEALEESFDEHGMFLSHAERLANMGSWDHDIENDRLRWSAQLYKIFGLDPATFYLTYEGFFQLIHPDDRHVIREGQQRALKKGGLLENEYRILHADGSERVLQQRGEVVYDDHGKAVRRRGMVIDVTERKRVEALAAGQREVLELVIADASLSAVLDAIVRLVEQRLPGAVASVLLLDRDQRLRLGSAPGLPAEYCAAIDGLEIGPEAGSCGTAAFLGKPVIVSDIANDPLWRAGRAVALAHGLKACWASPIFAREKTVLGTFAIYYHECHQPEPEEMATVEAVSHLAGLAISHIRAKEALRASDQQFANAFEHASIGMALVRVDGRFLKVNRALSQMLGYTEAELAQRSFQEITHPDDLTADLHLVGKVLAGEIDSYELEKRYFHKQGQTVWSLLSASLVRDAKGKAAHFIAQIQDVTQRKLAEEGLRRSEERYRLLFADNPLPMWVYDVESLQFLAVNAAAVQSYGYSEAEFMRMTITDLRPAEDVSPVPKSINFGVWRHRLKGGGQIDVEVSSDAIVFDGRQARLVLAQDVTARKRAEEQIAEQAALLDKAQDAIMVRSLDQVVLFWNKGAERLYGWTSEEVMGRKVSEFLCRDAKRLEEAKRVVLERSEWSGELLQGTKERREIRVESRWSLLLDSAGKPKSILSINTDITERKKLEAQFLRAQRLESIGTLAGGIAHDLNNVLAPIMMSIDLLRLRINDPVGMETLSLISSSARRGAEMVSQVLYFARGIEGERIAIDSMGLLRDLQRFIKETFPKNIAFVLQERPDLWPVIGDATQIYQVILNLCVNARDAMPAGGRVTVGVENVVIDEQRATESVDAKPGHFVVFEVRDTGSGIPAEIIDKIFDPFFTTKEVGKGTGLGLSTSVAIVRSHGGFVEVSSQAGCGACFRIYLPVGENAEGQAPIQASNELLPGRGELVLLVDDELSIRQVTGQTLETFGYRVLTAGHGAEALEMYEAHKGEVAVVLTDMMMPVMDGPALIQALRKSGTSVPIIAASGIGGPSHITKVADAGANHFIPKPYKAAALLKVLAEILPQRGV